jgi:hypothetical protein
MLAVALFIAFWVVVAGGLLTIAFRGGGGPRMARVVRRRRPVANVFIGCVYLGFVVDRKPRPQQRAGGRGQADRR